MYRLILISTHSTVWPISLFNYVDIEMKIVVDVLQDVTAMTYNKHFL